MLFNRHTLVGFVVIAAALAVEWHYYGSVIVAATILSFFVAAAYLALGYMCRQKFRQKEETDGNHAT